MPIEKTNIINFPGALPKEPDLPVFSAVVAMASNRVIGKGGDLPWHLPEDLKWFKQLTSGHPVVMGRKTYESIGKALPKRRNIVISRSLQRGDLDDAEVISSPKDLESLGLRGEIFIIGGAKVFDALLPICAKLYLTYIPEPYEGDTLFPPFEDEFAGYEVLANHDKFEIRCYSRMPAV